MNNSAANLVAVSETLNNLNRESYKPGILTQGVTHQRRLGRWTACMQANGKRFGDAWVEADESYLAAEHGMLCERTLMQFYAFATVTE